MALNATTLADLIKAAMQSEFGPEPPTAQTTANYQKLANVIATAVVNHIKNDAVVTGSTPTGGAVENGRVE